MDLAEVLKYKAYEQMSEDGIPDDDQPDKEPDYVEYLMEGISNKELLEWSLGAGLPAVQSALSFMKKDQPIDEFLIEVLFDAVSGA